MPYEKIKYFLTCFLHNLKTLFLWLFRTFFGFSLKSMEWRCRKYCLCHYYDKNSLLKNHLKNTLKNSFFCKIWFFSKKSLETLKTGIEALKRRLQLHLGRKNCFQNFTVWQFHQAVHKIVWTTANSKGWRYYPTGG
jgi:hypothetical protein